MKRFLGWIWRACRAAFTLGAILFCALAAQPATASHTSCVASNPKIKSPLPDLSGGWGEGRFQLSAPQLAFHAVDSSSSSSPTPQERERAKERSRRGRLLFLASLIYEGGLLVGFILLGGTRWLGGLTARLKSWLLALLAVFGIVTIGQAALTFPLDVYSGFTFQHQYGLSNQSFPQWLRDYGLEGAVGLLLGFPLVLGWYALMRRSPRHWWAWVGALSAPVSILLMLIVPIFINPLFNKFTPLEDKALRDDILAMAHAQGINAKDVYQVDASRQSNAVNAYVTGIGPTQRIVLYDTLLRDFTPEEIKYVMAHEMGHYVLGHIKQGIILSVLGAFLGSFLLFSLARAVIARWGDKLGLSSMAAPNSYPVMLALALVLSIISIPVSNALSRKMEWQADEFAARVYPHYDAGISAFHKLAKINVSEEDPPRWVELLLYSHPSLQRRIEALEAIKAKNDGRNPTEPTHNPL